MDGTVSSLTVIVRNNLRWPNGITVDYQSERIFWTDASLDRITSAELDGSNPIVLVSGMSSVPHPYSIGIYKVSF